MKKRILAAMLAAVMVVAVAAGCGKSSDSKTDASGDAESKDEARKVVLVTSGAGEPYSLLADDGTWTGIDAEMWAEIVSNRFFSRIFHKYLLIHKSRIYKYSPFI